MKLLWQLNGGMTLSMQWLWTRAYSEPRTMVSLTDHYYSSVQLPLIDFSTSIKCVIILQVIRQARGWLLERTTANLKRNTRLYVESLGSRSFIYFHLCFYEAALQVPIPQNLLLFCRQSRGNTPFTTDFRRKSTECHLVI